MKYISRIRLSADAVGPALLILTWLIFFSRTLLGQYVYFLDDLKILYYPLEYTYAQFQNAGQLPVWSNLFGFGQPLLAWGQLGFFTPLHVILRALQLHALLTLQISVVTYFALGLGGFYKLLRALKLASTPAALGALIYVFSGFSVGHLNHVNFYTGTMVLPWLLLTILYFIRKPNLGLAGLMATLAATIALSAQPQVVVYSYAIAILFALIVLISEWPTLTHRLAHVGRIVLYSVCSTAVAICLSSFAILPLLEFLPFTERSSDLPTTELYEFSYPPSHAITLLLPYFFGDHSSYWGAKGFQELAAFVGIIPLLLTGIALVNWRMLQPLRWLGLILCGIAVAFALGRYSPLYRWLVENHILTTLANPGRFVFFLDTGLAFLAALGLQDIIMNLTWSRRQIALYAIAGSLLVIVILTPFAIALTDPANSRWVLELETHLFSLRPRLILAVTGWIFFLLSLTLPRLRRGSIIGTTLLCLTAITLISFGWNYNPLTPRELAFSAAPFAAELTNFGDLPARLYARPELLVTHTALREVPSKHLAPDYSVIHPIAPLSNNPCYQLPVFNDGAGNGEVQVEVRENLAGPALSVIPLQGGNPGATSNQKFCIKATANRPYYLAFVSDQPSGLNFYYLSSASPLTYLVRIAKPTPTQLHQSQKNLRLDIEDLTAEVLSDDLVILSRHLQVTTNASSGRWLGALSLRSYREFVEMFFANDKDKDQVIDGEGVHFLERHRRVFNLAGITHFTQVVNDPHDDQMPAANLPLLAETTVGRRHGRLYTNPEAFPKAFLVPHALFIPADDEARLTLLDPRFDLGRLITVNGPIPPPQATLIPALENMPISADTIPTAANITEYTNTKVSLQINLTEPQWLVVTDSTTPEWQTFIDNELAPYYTADTLFKAAYVPAGQHTVSFVYDSPAIARAKQLSLLGLVGLLLLFLPSIYSLIARRGSSTSHVGVPPQTS